MRIANLLIAIDFGVFINLRPKSNWPKIIIYQKIAGLGIGPKFQCQLVALQANTSRGDTTSATSTGNFPRNMFAPLTVVVGTTILQNRMELQQDHLKATLGVETANLLTGENTGSSINPIDTLPVIEKKIAQAAICESLSSMRIFFVASRGLAFVGSLFAPSVVLKRGHKLAETGSEAEKEKRAGEAAREAPRKSS